MTEAAIGLAAGIQDAGAFERMPILADALEEAGCTDERILVHCRAPIPHVHRCWALRLLLDSSLDPLRWKRLEQWRNSRKQPIRPDDARRLPEVAPRGRSRFRRKPNRSPEWGGRTEGVPWWVWLIVPVAIAALSMVLRATARR